VSQTGRTVGRFSIVREVGRGGMATVYLADQPDLRRRVALKELSSFHARDASLAARFLREAQLSGSLAHPNIVTVYEYLVEDAIPYIAMEYCPRGSLRNRVHSVTLAQAAGVIEGVLAALAMAESRGVVHRDLKPENLMITSDGGIKITDFGIAKALDTAATPNLTMTGSTVGTPHYMAPEQAMGLEVGSYTDLYSVGIVAFEMLTGRVPYADTATPMAVLMRQVNEPIESISAVRPDLDPGICRWVDAMVAKDPAARPASAGAAWEQFEDAVLAVLGPRWRRQARLLGSAEELSTAKPLTPAPFASLGGLTVDAPTPEQVSPGGTAPTPQELQPLQTIAPARASAPLHTLDAPVGQPHEAATDAGGVPSENGGVDRAPAVVRAAADVPVSTETSEPSGDVAGRLRILGFVFLLAALLAVAVAAFALLHDSGSGAKGEPARRPVGTHLVASRPVDIGTRRVVLAAEGNRPWLMTRGEGNAAGTLAPVSSAGKPGTAIGLSGIPAGVGGGSGALWVLEVSGYQDPTVFLERVDPATGERKKVESFPDRSLSCISNGAVTCNPVVSGSMVWVPVEEALYGVSTTGAQAAPVRIDTQGHLWDFTAAYGSLWAIAGKSVLKIDPASGDAHEVLASGRFPQGLQPNHIAAGGGRIWVSAMSPPGRDGDAGRLVAIDANNQGRPTVIEMPHAGSIATEGTVLWVERYDGEDHLQALDARTGRALGDPTTLRDDIAWLVPLRSGLMASTYNASSHARTIVPLRTVS
jgi:serine/threonine protein kinase